MSEREGPAEADREADREAPQTGLRGSVAAGLRGEELTGAGMLAALGGVRGMLESFLPGFVFLVGYTLTRDVGISVIGPLALGLIAVLARALQRQSVQPALVGLAGIALCAATTLWTGKAEDFYLPGFWINAAYGAALLLSLLLGRPLLGYVIGATRGALTDWRSDPALVTAARLCTAVWLGLFVLRLAVQLPLYFAAQVELLGVARLVMGTPLFALVVLFTWLTVRRLGSAARPEQPAA